MGTTQSYGQSLVVKNDKKAIKLAEVVLKANSQLMANIQVNFGSSCFPKLWNYAVIELRKSNVDHPLTVRRFFQNNLPLIDDEQEQFQYVVLPNANEFVEMSGQFTFLKIPFCLKNKEIEPCDENGLSESLINHLNQSQYIYPDNPLYRDYYKQCYTNIFLEIGQSNGAFKSVGIIDLPQNNPYLGINNYNQVQDIIAGFLKALKSVQIHQLVFVSENKLQAQMMALGLEIMSKTCLSEYVDQNIMFQQEMEEEKQIDLENSNLQQIDLVQPKAPTKIISIKPQQSLSFQNGHIHFASSSYFRGEQPITQESIMELPITDKNEFQKCVCNRNTVIRTDQTFCCYCRVNRRNFWTCEERACGRKYCCSCKTALRSRFRCYKNHALSYTENLIDQNCIQCLRTPQRINLGSWQCSICPNFSICGNCYYNTQLGRQYQKTKNYYQIIQTIKPKIRKEIINDLVNYYLTTVEYEQLKKSD